MTHLQTFFEKHDLTHDEIAISLVKYFDSNGNADISQKIAQEYVLGGVVDPHEYIKFDNKSYQRTTLKLKRERGLEI